MSKHNYSQYSNKQNYNQHKAEEVEPKMVEEVVEPKAELDMTAPEVKMEPVVETKPEPAVEAPKPKVTTGAVTGCMKLNVRANPKSDADVLCVIDVDSKIELDMSKSTKEWYRVRTANGVDGYCMKKFIKKN